MQRWRREKKTWKSQKFMTVRWLKRRTDHLRNLKLRMISLVIKSSTKAKTLNSLRTVKNLKVNLASMATTEMKKKVKRRAKRA